MQVVGTIIEGELVVLAVERELTLADAVAIASDKGGAIDLVGFHKSLNAVEALDDVSYLALPVGHHDGTDGAAIVGDCHFVTFTVAQNV